MAGENREQPPQNAPPGQGQPKTRILLVDDDQIVLDSLGSFLRLDGYDVTAATAVAGAIDCLQASRYDLVITDVSMPGADGFELLRHVKAHWPDVVVIMITGYGTIESAVEAIKQGAYDYLTKPVIDDDVRQAVRRALQQQQLVAENRRLRAAMAGRGGSGLIIGQHYRMAKVFELIEAVADSPTTVLITGESGTGKSMIAREIHARSAHREGPFVEVACGALPDTLLESELFGHVRGAYTGAVADKAGKFAAADGGTIFLDEIATASPQLQVKFLRVLQDRCFEPVGSNETRQVDVRVILATHHDLAAEVQAGHFRKDLYYRINVVNIELPPLRDRIGDIPLLVDAFLLKYLEGTDRPIEGITREALARLQGYTWPGNVRELENVIERAVVLCRKSLIDVDDLPPVFATGAPPIFPILAPPEAGGSGAGAVAGAKNLRQALKEPEKKLIEAALAASGGNRQAAARQLGINRVTLYKKMKRYGLFSR
ncbi:MAG: sigma-54 dependent transcriptional regulator [Phycisphaerae bacterium]|jgi:DNA-binding NtrC family response regulator